MGVDVRPADPTTTAKLDRSFEFFTKLDSKLEPGPTYPNSDKTAAWAFTTTTYHYHYST